MIKFLQTLGCLCGQHDPMRDRSGSVLIYRCQWCLQDLGPILKKDEIIRDERPSGEGKAHWHAATEH
jgi:hypothetical protein